jgi:Xaa-Pro aminopeptidase
MSIWPLLSDLERSRRWALTHEFLRGAELSGLLFFGGRSREFWDAYVSNEVSFGGAAAVVFPRDSAPVYCSVSAARRFCREDRVEADTRHWISDFRVGLTSELVPSILRERGLAHARIGVVGLKSVGPAGEEEGVIPHEQWRRILAAVPEVTFVDVSSEYALLMLPKSDEEMTLVRYGAAIGERACQAVIDTACIGAAETELIGAAMREIWCGGAVPVAPTFLLRTGPTDLGHAPPHWLASKRAPRVLQAGDLVLAEIFATFGGIETQQQLTLVIGPASPSQRFVADIARASYEVGLRCLRPGVWLSEVFREMQKVVLEAGCWHINPLIHSLAPLIGWGGMLNGLSDQSQIYPVLRQLAPSPVMGDLLIREGMIFAVEPSVAKEKERVSVGATVLVTANGCEELNSLGTALVTINR